MSVAEPLRHKGRLEVHIKAQALANYTSQILSNKKVFDPEIDEDLIKRMKNCAVEIYIKAWQANKIRADTNSINRMDKYYKSLWEDDGNAKSCQADGTA